MPSGEKYEGNWLNGKKNGDGICIKADGREIEGVWENGKRVQWKNKK